MKRRDFLKSIPVAGMGLGANTENLLPNEAPTVPIQGYKNGKSPEEQKHDIELNAKKLLSAHELATVTILADIIIPADSKSASASQVGVPAYINFMLKDQPTNQTAFRGGLLWLDNLCLKKFSKTFAESASKQRIEIVEAIAYPANAKPEMSQGVAFFTMMRNFTLSGFYTSKVGIADIGYIGNVPHIWAGPPQEVLDQYGLSYDKDTHFADMD